MRGINPWGPSSCDHQTSSWRASRQLEGHDVVRSRRRGLDQDFPLYLRVISCCVAREASYHHRRLSEHIVTALGARESVASGTLVERMELRKLDALDAPGEPKRFVHFVEEGILSVISHIDDKRDVELGVVGREGMSGDALVLDRHSPCMWRCRALRCDCPLAGLRRQYRRVLVCTASCSASSRAVPSDFVYCRCQSTRFGRRTRG